MIFTYYYRKMLRDPISRIEHHLAYKVFKQIKSEGDDNYTNMKNRFLTEMKELIVSQYDKIYLSVLFSEILIYDLIQNND